MSGPALPFICRPRASDGYPLYLRDADVNWSRRQILLADQFTNYNAHVILFFSFRWSEPSAWPWFVWVWIAFMLAGWVRPAWNAFKRHREASWPSVLGRIEIGRA